MAFYVDLDGNLRIAPRAFPKDVVARHSDATGQRATWTFPSGATLTAPRTITLHAPGSDQRAAARASLRAKRHASALAQLEAKVERKETK